MCKCTPEIRTPFCGRLSCEWPDPDENDSKEVKSSFGKNLKEVLSFLEMSQTHLAEKSGLTTAAISQIISGDRDPSLSSIIKILKVVPVTFERLIR